MVRMAISSGEVLELVRSRNRLVVRPISSDEDSQSGPRPYCALIDELHEHKSDVVVNMMRAGFKWRRPLEFEITNSG
jgi:phage terminase large subunit-like protein